jgi:hypothetical protein
MYLENACRRRPTESAARESSMSVPKSGLGLFLVAERYSAAVNAPESS